MKRRIRETGGWLRPGIAVLLLAGAITWAFRMSEKRVSQSASEGDLLWSFQAQGGLTGAPAIDLERDGSYFGTLDGLLFAVDGDGVERWRFDYAEHGTSGLRAQAFHGAPAIGEDGTIYIGDDVVTPNFFFAIQPDGEPAWVYETWGSYSQIDTSPALDRRGRVYAGAHGWGAGVDNGEILVFDPTGHRLEPLGHTGPIGASPGILEDDRVVFAVHGHDEWVLPSPTATLDPDRTPTGSPTASPTASATSHRTATALPTSTSSPSRSATPTAVATSAPRFLPWLPAQARATSGARLDESAHAQGQPPPHGGGTPPASGARGRPLLRPRGRGGRAAVATPPGVTAPVPARLHLLDEDSAHPTVRDLEGLDGPGSLAVDGAIAWLGLAEPRPAVAAFDLAAVPGHAEPGASRGPALAPVRYEPLTAEVAGSPVLGRREEGWLEVLVLATDGTLTRLDVPDDPQRPARRRWSPLSRRCREGRTGPGRRRPRLRRRRRSGLRPGALRWGDRLANGFVGHPDHERHLVGSTWPGLRRHERWRSPCHRRRGGRARSGGGVARLPPRREEHRRFTAAVVRRRTRARAVRTSVVLTSRAPGLAAGGILAPCS